MEAGRGNPGFGAAMAERRKAKRKSKVLQAEVARDAKESINEKEGSPIVRRRHQYEPNSALSPARTRGDEEKTKPALYSPGIKVVSQERVRRDSEGVERSAKRRLVNPEVSQLFTRVSKLEAPERFRTSAPQGNCIISLELLNKFLSTPCEQSQKGQGRLRMIGEERKMGLSSCIIFECKCGAHYSFQTSESVNSEDSRGGPEVRAVDYMGVVGSIAADHGLKGLQIFLASLDLPSMGQDAYDALMDAVVRATKKVGQRSFRAARETEI